MRTYWKKNGALVLMADDDDDMEDLMEWIQEYQGGAVEMLEIDTESMNHRQSSNHDRHYRDDADNHDFRMQHRTQSGRYGQSEQSQRTGRYNDRSDQSKRSSNSRETQHDDGRENQRRPRR